MTVKEDGLLRLFREKAEAAAIKVLELRDFQEVLTYALEECVKKDFCEIIHVGEGVRPGSFSKADKKMIAAPGLSKQRFAAFEKAGKEKGVTALREGLRAYISGIDVGVLAADMGIAETATAVLASDNEDARLAAMISEICVLSLPKVKLVRDLYDAEDFLRKVMDKGSTFTSFISGASRTADIERVLTIGAHGPLELHVALTEA